MHLNIFHVRCFWQLNEVEKQMKERPHWSDSSSSCPRLLCLSWLHIGAKTKTKKMTFVTHNGSFKEHLLSRFSWQFVIISSLLSLSLMFVFPAFFSFPGICLLDSVRPVSCISLSLLVPVWQRGTCQSQWRTWGPTRHLSPSAWPLTSTSEGSSWSWWKRHVGYCLSASVRISLWLSHTAQTKDSDIIWMAMQEFTYTALATPKKELIYPSCITAQAEDSLVIAWHKEV